MRRKTIDIQGSVNRKRIEDARNQAEWIIQSCNINQYPVMPLDIAATESAILKVRSGDYGRKFDGRLEYHKEKKRFILFYNNRYNIDLLSEGNAPRTRFSIAHELGHYFLDTHHDFLRNGGKSHPSRSEFSNHIMMEREADAFASALLMPKKLFKPIVNEGDLSLRVIGDLADRFKTSFIATAIRSVLLSDFYCALAGLKNGKIDWMFKSGSMIEKGFYPKKRGMEITSQSTLKWMAGNRIGGSGACFAKDWFQIFDKDYLINISVTEEFQSIPVMGMELVLLTIPEDELEEDD